MLPFLKEKTINIHKIHMWKNMLRGNSQHKHICMYIQRMYVENKQVRVGTSQKGNGRDEGQKWESFLHHLFMDLSNFIPYDNENKFQKNCSVLHLEEPSHHSHHFTNMSLSAMG